MRSSWQVGIVILTLVGLSGCAGVQQRGRSSSPMQGLSVDAPGKPGWPTRLFRWRFASAERPIETTRRAVKAPAVGPETDIWPDRGRSVLSRLLTAFPSRSKGTETGAGAGSSFLSRRESSPSSGELTVAEANAAIARAARPRPAPGPVAATRDASVLTTRGEAPADDSTKVAELETPPLLETPIALPGDDEANEVSAPAPASASAIEPDAILTQAPPPPPLRPTPRPVEPKPEVEPTPEPQPEPAEITPPIAPVKPVEPAPEPKPEPEPEPKPVEVVPPAETETKPEPKSEPIETMKPVESPRTVEPEGAPATEAPGPFAESRSPRYAPVVAGSPQVYFDSPGQATAAPAPLRPHEDAPARWSFWSWKKTPSHGGGGGFPIETSAQLPAVQFPASYGVAPTPQGRVVFPSAQVVTTAPVEKCWRLKALGARIHDKLERLRAWKHEHICRHIQNLKAALKGKCLGCGGHVESIVHPLASPQSAPVLGTSQFGLY